MVEKLTGLKTHYYKLWQIYTLVTQIQALQHYIMSQI
jgi:hypothetical protein